MRDLFGNPSITFRRGVKIARVYVDVQQGRHVHDRRRVSAGHLTQEVGHCFDGVISVSGVVGALSRTTPALLSSALNKTHKLETFTYNGDVNRFSVDVIDDAAYHNVNVASMANHGREYSNGHANVLHPDTLDVEKLESKSSSRRTRREN